MSAPLPADPERTRWDAEAPWLQPGSVQLSRRLLNSHRQAFGRPLLSPRETRLSDRQAAQELFAAGVVVLAHDDGDDPRLIYANRPALGLWGHRWSSMIGMPSRLTAEAERRNDRRRLLERARAAGALEGYTGVRIDRHGRRFLIRQARLWSLGDAGRSSGQAAAFSDWCWID